MDLEVCYSNCGCVLTLCCAALHSPENPPDGAAGAAAGRGAAPVGARGGGAYPGLRRERRRPLAAAHAQDGGPAQAGQRLCGLLQDFRAGGGPPQHQGVMLQNRRGVNSIVVVSQHGRNMSTRSVKSLHRVWCLQ